MLDQDSSASAAPLLLSYFIEEGGGDMAREFLGVLRPLPPPEHSDLIRGGGSEDGLHQEPLPLLQRREHQQPKLSLQAERCGDGHLLYTYRQRITEEGGLFYRPALTEMSTGRGGVLICPSYLHRTAVGITESRWATSPNAPSTSSHRPLCLSEAPSPVPLATSSSPI